MNLLIHTKNDAVIPAKAGIQMIKDFPHMWDDIMVLFALRSILLTGCRPSPG